MCYRHDHPLIFNSTTTTTTTFIRVQKLHSIDLNTRDKKITKEKSTATKAQLFLYRTFAYQYFRASHRRVFQDVQYCLDKFLLGILKDRRKHLTQGNESVRTKPCKLQSTVKTCSLC